jgi:hypothetical protein
VKELRDLLLAFAFAARLDDGKRLKELSSAIEQKFVYDRDNTWSDGYNAGRNNRYK